MTGKTTSHGNMLVLMIPFVFIFFGLSLFVWDSGRGALESGRAQTVADAVLLSSLRVRVEGLETVADRWLEFGSVYVEGYPNQEVLVPGSQWTHVQQKAEALRRAISGYRGRITAVLRVVAEANGLDFEGFDMVRDDAQELGLTAEAVTLRDEEGRRRTIAGGWYRRRWAPEERAPQPPEVSELHVAFKVPRLGADWVGAEPLWDIQETARVRLRWDVDPNTSLIRERGNGGFPKDWLQALEGNHVNPHRFPLFAARLQAHREPD